MTDLYTPNVNVNYHSVVHPAIVTAAYGVSWAYLAVSSKSRLRLFFSLVMLFVSCVLGRRRLRDLQG